VLLWQVRVLPTSSLKRGEVLVGAFLLGARLHVRNLEMVIEQLQIPTSIPPEVFADTWLLPPPIALAVAQLDSRLLAHAQMFHVFGTTDAIVLALQRVNLAPALEESLGSIERLATTVMKYTAEVSDEVVRRDRATRS
jgi:hypothetical protein